MEQFFNYGDQYIEEVIRPLLPNANLDWFCGNDYYLESFNLLKNSIYERKEEEPSYFLHFTSISSLLEIIRSKTIRMSDFNCFKDKFELTLAGNNLVNKESNFEGYKSSLFALSLCEDTEENRKDDYMWKKYGDNHRGVCIQLKVGSIKNTNSNFFLGDIIYAKSKEIKELNELKERHHKFKTNYGKAINNLDEALLTICSMYKKARYKQEHETRLLAHIHKIFDVHTDDRYPLIWRYNSKTDLIEYLLELKLGSSKKDISQTGYFQPDISIEKIIFHANTTNSIGEIRGNIRDEFEKAFCRDFIPIFV